MAIAERMLNARFGDAICNHFTYVIAGDGCLMEGISHEAIDLAGHLKLGKLIVLFDDNEISIDGPTALSTSMDQIKRFEAAGWAVSQIDGHDPARIEAAIANARESIVPSLIACRTIIGYGAPNKQGTEKAHGSALGKDEVAAARARLAWPHAPFEVPGAIMNAWRAVGARGAGARETWDSAVRDLPTSAREQYQAMMSGEVPLAVSEQLNVFKADVMRRKPKLATRKASEMALQIVNEACEITVGGSADLTHSNYTLTKGFRAVTAAGYSGRYIYYGIREHVMAAAMNGIALHGGFIPYGGTFLVFSDYMRGAMRLSALMGLRVIYVLTHDSIGVGEDGPTHQPIEHLAMLRATPNLQVFRPADAVETAEAYEIALMSRATPSALCLSRQNLETVRHHPKAENLTAKGAYVLREPDRERDVTILATGSEVEIALAAAGLCAQEGIAAAVVSMPCWELFETQPEAYREQVLGKAPRVGIEAAASFGWNRWLGADGAFIGMHGFGASGPYLEVYRHFGITAEDAIKAARVLVQKRGRSV